MSEDVYVTSEFLVDHKDDDPTNNEMSNLDLIELVAEEEAAVVASEGLEELVAEVVAEPENDPILTAHLAEVAKFTSSLRGLADFYDANPRLKLPFSCSLTVYGIDKDDLGEYARAFGAAEKVYNDYSFNLVKKFGSLVSLQTYHSREAVCERVKVGEETVPGYVKPAKPAEPEVYVETHTREKFEWRCPEFSLLKPKEESAPAVAETKTLDGDQATSPSPDEVGF
jgi:hypothetical protein